MPDISMCMNVTCPSKNICYRFMAKPNPYWQSYCNYEWEEETGKCLSWLELYKNE